MPSWLIWAAIACVAFIAGFFLGVLVSADARMAEFKRSEEDEF